MCYFKIAIYLLGDGDEWLDGNSCINVMRQVMAVYSAEAKSQMSAKEIVGSFEALLSLTTSCSVRVVCLKCYNNSYDLV